MLILQAAPQAQPINKNPALKQPHKNVWIASLTLAMTARREKRAMTGPKGKGAITAPGRGNEQ